tara:strand:+ start:7882 stop:8259 length:378 start_codon:yes stop_codon:yes gene_type:complete
MVVGCSSTSSGLYTNDSPTMAQIYHQSMLDREAPGHESWRSQLPEPYSINSANTKPSTAAGLNVTSNKNTFPLIPNPQVTLYVYPHLAGDDEAPVPGYQTAFFLYKSQHFAMPGEVSTSSGSYYA